MRTSKAARPRCPSSTSPCPRRQRAKRRAIIEGHGVNRRWRGTVKWHTGPDLPDRAVLTFRLRVLSATPDLGLLPRRFFSDPSILFPLPDPLYEGLRSLLLGIASSGNLRRRHETERLVGT